MSLRLPVSAALTAALLGLGAAPAYAGNDTWRVPDTATITVKGHGFGHGHGMSQYGAEGAARQGLTYRQIAEFYYPGTSWGRATGPIRVLITADTTDDLVVLARPGLRVRDGGGDPVVLPDNGATRWRTMLDPGGRTRVAWLDDRGWHRWATLTGDGSFDATGAPVSLVTPAGTKDYRGRLVAASTGAGSRDRVTVNRLPLEAYLRGVVPLEMPALWSPEAVRTQAVAARTYAAYEREHPATAYDLCDTWSCQVYGGVAAEHPSSDAAVTATARRVLTYDAAPAFTQFGSSSGGWTSAGSVPYLTAQADPYDDWAGNPVHDWSVRLTAKALETRWSSLGNLTRITVTQRDGNGDWGGRVASLRLVGSKHSVVLTGDAFRSALGLRSSWVTFRVS